MRANDALDVHVKPLLVSVKRSSAQHNIVGDSCACGGKDDDDDDDGSSNDDDNWADDDDSSMTGIFSDKEEVDDDFLDRLFLRLMLGMIAVAEVFFVFFLCSLVMTGFVITW
jgi:hypothetical protein